MLSVAVVSKNFKQVNIHEAAGLDRLPGRVLRACTDQLASVFTDIFKTKEMIVDDRKRRAERHPLTSTGQ